MQTISSLKLRNELGEVLDQVRYERKPIVVTRHKKMIAILLPVEEGKTKQKKLLRPPVDLSQISPRLRKLIGVGRYISLKEEKRELKKYLAKKY